MARTTKKKERERERSRIHQNRSTKNQYTRTDHARTASPSYRLTCKAPLSSNFDAFNWLRLQ